MPTFPLELGTTPSERPSILCEEGITQAPVREVWRPQSPEISSWNQASHPVSTHTHHLGQHAHSLLANLQGSSPLGSILSQPRSSDGTADGPMSRAENILPAFPISAMASLLSGRYQRALGENTKASMRQTVYVIRCVQCNTFFTDRGMKAVLLLKPHAPLFSTDAIPSNCNALYANETHLGQELGDNKLRPRERTCSCLTQTLGCSGCGSVVGYNVVSPCTRCSESATKHSRSLNGHRVVFHDSEISTHPKRYVPGDQGVNAMVVPLRLKLLLEEHQLLLSHLRSHLHPQSLYCEQSEGNSLEEAWLRRLWKRLHLVNQSLWVYYSSLTKQYRAGARIILAGETVCWSDINQHGGGDRCFPFDPDDILNIPAARR